MQCLKKIRNRIWTHNHSVCKRTLNHLAKLKNSLIIRQYEVINTHSQNVNFNTNSQMVNFRDSRDC